MARIKICGLTNIEDALLSVREGAHALGFIFAPSPRRVTQEQVRGIAEAIPPFVTKVGVFVDHTPQEILEIMTHARLNLIQLHGEYSVEECAKLSELHEVVKVFRVADHTVIEAMKPYVGKVQAFLLDTYHKGLYGGTGETFNWKIALEAKKLGVPIILSGGLTPGNVLEAVKAVNPYAIDISSGVEQSPGKKDPEKIKLLFKALR